jgi:excisionase family DNA binding protein
MLEKMYTCAEIAERYKVQIPTVHDWIRSQKLSAINLGKGYRVKESDLLSFEQANKTTNANSEE